MSLSHMVDIPGIIGIAGGVILVAGAASPDRPILRPVASLKNWLFAVGGFVMLVYSVMNWRLGGSVFFVFLEGLVNLSSVFMMLDTDDRIDAPIIGVATVGLILWSLRLFPGFRTILFILGLAGVAVGYCSDAGTRRRETALLAGSALIAGFSYLEHNWIFLWLNFFFAVFSLSQLVFLIRPRRPAAP